MLTTKLNCFQIISRTVHDMRTVPNQYHIKRWYKNCLQYENSPSSLSCQGMILRLLAKWEQSLIRIMSCDDRRTVCVMRTVPHQYHVMRWYKECLCYENSPSTVSCHEMIQRLLVLWEQSLISFMRQDRGQSVAVTRGEVETLSHWSGRVRH